MRTTKTAKPLPLPKNEKEFAKVLVDHRKMVITEVRREIVKAIGAMNYVTPEFIKRKIDSL